MPRSLKLERLWHHSVEIGIDVDLENVDRRICNADYLGSLAPEPSSVGRGLPLKSSGRLIDGFSVRLSWAAGRTPSSK